MRWFLCAVVSVFIAISAYNYGYRKGQTEAPEFVRLEEIRVSAEAKIEIEKLKSRKRNSLSPEECLPIVVDPALDLAEFCNDYLGKSERDPAEGGPEPDY